jgi:transposase
MVGLESVGLRSYIAEPDRGRRDWSDEPEAQAPVYRNRRRIRGTRGRRLMRRRGEYIERSFAHLYNTGGMRRTHLRGHQNILKRLLIHAGGFNLGLVVRSVLGVGTPRGLQGRVAAVIGTLLVLLGTIRTRVSTMCAGSAIVLAAARRQISVSTCQQTRLAPRAVRPRARLAGSTWGGRREAGG